jgi:hypothetical protein
MCFPNPNEGVKQGRSRERDRLVKAFALLATALVFSLFGFTSRAHGAVTMLPPTSITASSALLQASIYSGDAATTTYFEWGLTTNYGNTTPNIPLPPAPYPTSIAQPIGTLLANTTYHARAVATNENGTRFSTNISFITASGTSTTLTNGSDAELRAAIANCGTVLLDFDGTVNITNAITISCSVTLDASGHAVTLSGGNSNRLFNVQAGASLTLINLTLANAQLRGTNGNPAFGFFPGQGGQPGQSVEGGAILISSATLVVENCTFTNCSATGGDGGDAPQRPQLPGPGGTAMGGAISARSSSLVFSNCTFAKNTASAGWSGFAQYSFSPTRNPASGIGGAIVAIGSMVNVFTCQFRTNQATTSGGALDGSGAGSMSVADSGFSGNAAGFWGGAIDLNGGNLSIQGSAFEGNSAFGVFYYFPSRGGALCVLTGNVQVFHCNFANNRCAGTDEQPTAAGATAAQNGFGGAVTLLAGTTAISHCGFRNNSVFGGNGRSPGWAYGGALYNDGGTMITNCTFASNQARGGSVPFPYVGVGSSRGGALVSGANSLTLASCTIATNKATDAKTNSSSGGGINQSGNGTITIINSVLAGNAANTNANGNASGAITDGGHNLSSDATPAWTSGTSLNNTDPLLLPLADNGGPTLTMALRVGSPALNNGDPVNFPPIDQRGFPRPGGGGPDIGAWEGAGGHVTLTMLRENPSTNLLTWPTDNGSFYRVEAALELNQWVVLASNLVGNGSPSQFRHTNAVVRFFRVATEP